MKATRILSILVFFVAGMMVLSSCKKDDEEPMNDGPGDTASFSLDCIGATHNGTLTDGQAASGTSSEIPYSGGDGETYGDQTVASEAVTGLTASLAAGTLADGNGNLTFAISGTPAGIGVAFFAISIGGETCTFSRSVDGSGSITSLNCTEATSIGTLQDGQIASSVSSQIPYSGGNGGTHNGQTVVSTGVTGLTATLGAGTFANGNGTLTYAIAGTPAGSGTANFALNIGGQICGLSITVTEAPLAIGDTFQGGLVFYLDGSNGGLIAAPLDQSADAEWGCIGTEVGADGEGVGTGGQNTIDILAGCSESGIAADICANLTLNGYDDWVLPSIEELDLIHQNLHLQGLGNFSDSGSGDYYWSSTEVSGSIANIFFFFDGDLYNANKGFTYRVRAVRAF